jgi:hypothetical protein
VVVAGSDEQWRGEVGPRVGEMAGEVGDPIWSPVKEEAHQRGFTEGGGRKPLTVGWWSGGGRRLEGRGAAVSSGRGRCGEGGLKGRSKRPIRAVMLGG